MMDPKLKLDVPPQVREFAQKSVDQAERAISSFMESATIIALKMEEPSIKVLSFCLGKLASRGE